MLDRYTKSVLTIIVGALVALVAQNAMRTSFAQSYGCGSSGAPCAVAWIIPMRLYSIVKLNKSRQDQGHTFTDKMMPRRRMPRR